MNEQQKQFLQLHLIEGKSYEKISLMMSVARKELSIWYEELKSERLLIARIRTIWLRKKMEAEVVFNDFYSWYISQERKCFYCSITELEIKYMLEIGLLATKRIDTRGRTLELDRRRHDASYSDLDNLTLACYWCNNAKTDTFTDDEFKEVGQAFAKIWQARLAQSLLTSDSPADAF